MSNESSFFTRVIGSDPARKGFAAAIAGLVVAVVTEALWPSEG